VLALREMLVRGDFAAGQRLTELALAARLGASRTPVRHALNRLAHEGLLEALPTGGFSVRRFTLADIWDTIEIRGALEGLAARLAAQRCRAPRELSQLRVYCAEMEALGVANVPDFVRFLEINQAFHAELWRLARSPMLLRSIEAITALPFAAPGALVFGEAERTSERRIRLIALEHHRSIVGTGWGEGRERGARALARRPKQPDAGAPRPGTAQAHPGRRAGTSLVARDGRHQPRVACVPPSSASFG
jgi:GntR family transcriptional regulator of vanillate catabolism